CPAASDHRQCVALQEPGSGLPVAGLFFGGLLTATFTAVAIRREVGQPVRHFANATTNRIAIQSSNERELPQTESVGSLGKRSHIPAALRFGQSAQQEINSVMVF